MLLQLLMVQMISMASRMLGEGRGKGSGGGGGGGGGGGDETMRKKWEKAKNSLKGRT